MTTVPCPTRVVTEPRRSARSGLTLLEVVISSAVLAVVLVGVFSSMAHAMRMNALSREREAATNAAMARLDDVVMTVSTTTEFDALVTPGYDQGFDVPYDTGKGVINLSAARANPNPNGVLRLQVAAHPDGTYDGIEHLAEATATVRWHGADDRDAEVVITSWKVRPGS